MQNEFTWLARDAGLQLFGGSRHEALETFHRFIMSGIGQDDEIDFKRGIAKGIVGDDLFIEKMREENNRHNCRVSETIEIDLNTLLSVVADWHEIDVEGLRTLENDRKALKSAV